MDFTQTPIIISKYDDEIYIPHYVSGYQLALLPSEARRLIAILTTFCMSYTDEEIALKNKSETANYFDNYVKSTAKKATTISAGFIYLLRCETAYKIGFSKDVNRRIKELSNIPFDIKLLASWYDDEAYSIEQQLHSLYKEYNIGGEGYSSELPIDSIDKTIQELRDRRTV